MGDQTQLIISIETILRGLDKTLRGLSQVEKQLRRVASVTTGTQGTANLNRATAATQRLQQQQQRAALSAQRLAQSQQTLGVRAQQLANAQARADQATQRLTASQGRLAAASAKTTQQLNQQADHHVRAFRAIERANQQAINRILGVGNALRSVGQGLASLGATLTVSLTAPLVGLGVASVDAAVRLDSLKRGLTAITGSSEEANRQLARLTQIAKLPGIGFEEAIQGSIRLQAVGFSAAEAEKDLREFSNAVALTGGGRDELARVTVQLGQLAAKGKVLSQDLRPIIEAAPAVGRALLAAFGTVNAADIQELGLSSKEFLGILVDELSRLPRAAAGAKNSFENFRDEVFRAAAAVGEALLPTLTRFVEVVGPVITRLAEAFAALPGPLQVVVVGVGALLAALGPVLFVVGQLTLGAGRLLVGLVELSAAGILPSITNLRALTTQALAAASAQRTLGVSSLALGGIIGGVAALLATVVAAYVTYRAFQKDSITLSKEHFSALTDEINGLKQQAQFIEKLKTGVERTASEQERLLDIYNRLNISAQARVTGIKDEDERLAKLRAELQLIIDAKDQERIQGAARLAATVAENALIIESEDEVVQSLARRVQANTALIESLERTGKVTPEIAKELARFASVAGGNVTENIRLLREENARLVEEQNKLRKSNSEVRDSLKEQVPILQQMTRETGRNETQLLSIAKTMGLYEANIDRGTAALRRYIEVTEEARQVTDAFSRIFGTLLTAGEAADKQQKERKALIEAAADLAREATDSFDGARKSVEAFIAAQPQLRQAIEREAQIEGKSFGEVIDDALQKAFGRQKGNRDRSGTALRNAQEQLAQALAEVAQASAEEQGAIEKRKNDDLLEINENAFQLQLRAYRDYLNTRAALTSANLQLEINAQRRVIDIAQAERDRFNQRAGQPRLPAAEREKARAGAAAAEETIIKARTKINELEEKQRDLVAEVSQALAVAAKQQIADTRKLEIEYAELKGNIEDAANAGTIERFREELEKLGREQDHLNRLETAFADILSREDKEDIKVAKARNQRQVEAINNITRQELALNKLAGAQDIVEKAKQRQSNLEEQIANDVELRGQTEDEATRRRLAGEVELRAELIRQRNEVEAVALALFDAGRTVPKPLVQFIAQTDIAIDRLGKLTLGEQFQRAEKDFNRINDERLRRIADVDRAVRTGNISEVEGTLKVRQANRDLIAELERRLEVLRRIAIESNDDALIRQVRDLEDELKDARAELASFGRQVRSATVDALQDSLTNFLVDLTDRTKTAKEKLLGFVNSLAASVNRVIAENLSRRFVESLFGTGGTNAGGIIAGIKRLFGFGGDAGKGGIAGAAGKALEGTGAATALQAGATAAAATTTASAITFATSVTTAATAFATLVATAGAAFAASVGAASGAQAAASLGSGIGNFATGDILPARSGGRVVRVAEAGHAEAVLTTDPRHAVKQARILSRFLRMTRGLQGRFPVPNLASGALISPRDVELNMLRGLQRTPLSNANLENAPLAAAGGGTMRLRQVLVDQRDVGNWMNSSEGETVFRDMLVRNRPLIRDLGGRR